MPLDRKCILKLKQGTISIIFFQNFGWKIRVLSPGENGSSATFRHQNILQTFLLVATFLYLNSHKSQIK